jgi:hypothetical protein
LPSLSQASLFSAFPDPTIVLTYGSWVGKCVSVYSIANTCVHPHTNFLTSVSAFKFHRSNLPLPSTAPNNAGWLGDHLTSYTWSSACSNVFKGKIVVGWVEVLEMDY